MQICIYHKKKEGCVEELDNEYTISDEARLLRKCVIANAHDKLNNNETQDIVYCDDRKLGNLVINHHSLQVIEVFIANARVKLFP